MLDINVITRIKIGEGDVRNKLWFVKARHAGFLVPNLRKCITAIKHL